MVKNFDEVKEIAFGWLGLLPDDFYRMDVDDFSLMCKGFFAKRKQDQLQFANVAFCVDAIGWGLAGKPANYKKFIADWFGEKPKVTTQEDLKKRSDTIMEKLAIMQKIQDEKDKLKPKKEVKKKNARAVKNNN